MQFECGHQQQVVCSKEQFEGKCKEQVMIDLTCGHMRIALCGNQSVYKSIPCDKMVEKQMPCGHNQQVECHKDPNQSLCRFRVEHELACLHVTEIPCGLTTDAHRLSTLTCRESVSKLLRCGHPKFMECGEDPLSKKCEMDAEVLLDCGHSVTFNCEGIRVEQLSISCRARVEKQLACGHVATDTCSNTKAICKHQLVLTLGCGHSVKTLCHKSDSIRCQTLVPKMLNCGHTKQMGCCDSTDSAKCSVLVPVQRPSCAHPQEVPCCIRNDDIELRSIKCKVEALKTLKCGHQVTVPCHQDVEQIQCSLLVTRELSCGHIVLESCVTDVRKECVALCCYPMDCSHLCSLPCHPPDKSHLCTSNKSEKLECGHSQTMPCGRNPLEATCFELLQLKLTCGHVCVTSCQERKYNPEPSCNKSVWKQLPCGHSQNLSCSQKVDDLVCQERVEHVLGCRHTVQTKCSVPLEHRLKLMCQVKSEKKLPCGHDITVACGSKKANENVENVYCK